MDTKAINDLREELEGLARHRQSVKEEKSEANARFSDELKAIDKGEDKILGKIDMLINPPPQQKMEFEE